MTASDKKKNIVDEVREEIIAERVRQLEEAVMSLSADIQNISNAVREMQRYIVKMATNQQQMAERVSIQNEQKVLDLLTNNINTYIMMLVMKVVICHGNTKRSKYKSYNANTKE